MTLEQINPTTWRNFKSRENTTWETEIGDAQDPANFRAQVKAKRWNNECNFSIRLPLAGTITPTHNGDTVNFTSLAGIAGAIYETQDGFKFDIILPFRPGFNGVAFTVQHKNVRYAYQPIELTPFEVARGNFRPDEIKGSYAVFHGSGKRDNEYQTGKMMHIKRPVLIDANDNRSWVEMIITPIDADTASVQYNFDSAWLDNAAYPVTIDPTFGYTSAGGSDNNLNDYLMTQKHNFSGTTNSTIDNYNVHCGWQSSSTEEIEIGIYDHNGTDNEPENLLEGVAATRSVSTTKSWQQINGAGTQTLTSGTDYWLATCSDIGYIVTYDVDAGEYASYRGPGFTALPDPYGNETGNLGWIHSIYVNYSEPAGGSLIVDPKKRFFNHLLIR